jgi:capsular polysaccharide transport system ATP-binding protein
MLELRQLTKSYPTRHGRRYVFRNLNFTFPTGVSIGLVGPNGAGKSTLVQLIGKTNSPDSGEIVTDQRISWPVGLSGGFQGSLTGRDNIEFVCRLYGTDKARTRQIVGFVRDFAEIGGYFDLPVKSYSTGMRSRVAFGLSMAFNFDYYLIDEVMAVGDAQFKQKSQAIFREKSASSNLILVSHNMNDIRKLCQVVVLVQDGDATLYEDVEAGITAYQQKPAAAAAGTGTSVGAHAA